MKRIHVMHSYQVVFPARFLLHPILYVIDVHRHVTFPWKLENKWKLSYKKTSKQLEDKELLFEALRRKG